MKDLTRSEAAKMLGVTGQTVDNYRKRGLLEPYRFGEKGRWRYKMIDVIRFKEGFSREL
jgi:DNA-binding transcriptional MerR regulator